MPGFGSKQTLQQLLVSVWFMMWCDVVVLWTILAYGVVWHVRWFCGGLVVGQLNDSFLSNGCFLLPQATLQRFKITLYRKQDKLDFCDETDVTFSMGWVLFLVNVLLLNVIFVLISLVMLLEIGICVSGSK